MLKLMQKKLNKKGFTLAELLIVVAIIAILVAIAMPLFTGALERAEKATFLANQRSIKAAGVASMLSDEDFELPTTSAPYYASATISDDGDIVNLSVSKNDPGDSKDWDTWKGKGKTGTIVAVITSTELDAEID